MSSTPHTLIDETPVMGLVIARRNGTPHVVDCNDSFLDTLGYDRDDVVGRPVDRVYSAESREALLADGLHPGGDEGRASHCQLVSADGRVVRTLLHAGPLGDEDGASGRIRALYVNLDGHERVQRELTESKHKIEKLHDVAAEMVACTEEEAIYDLTVSAAEDILEFDICGVDVVNDGYFVPKAISTGMASDGYDSMAVGDGIAGRTFRTGESILVDDVREAKDGKPVQDEYRSLLSVPIGQIGIFQAGSKHVGAFTRSDLELAELLMTHVTEALNRIALENARHESEEKYRTLVEQSTEAIYIYRGSEFLFLNDRAAEISGYTKKELYGMEMWDLIHPDDRNWVFRLVERRAAGKHVPPTYEARVLTREGAVKHCEFSVTEITYRGEPALLGSARDVTARKEREDTLNALQETTRQLMKAKTPDEIARLLVRAVDEVLDFPIGIVWFADGEEHVLRPVVATTGIDESELPTYGPGSSQTWEVFETGETRAYEHVRERDDLSEESVGSGVVSPLGDHGVFLIASEEEDELSESQIDLVKLLAANAEAALDRAEREVLLRERERELAAQNEKLEFLNSLLRHNILNGMAVVLGRTELLAERADERQREHLETISLWGEDIVALVRKIRRLMDSALGQAQVEPRPVDLTRVLEEECEKIRTSYDAEVTVNVDDGVAVLADEMLPEIVEDVLSNGVVHNPDPEPSLHVTAEFGSESVRVRITDDGPGIHPDKQDKIFGRGKKGLKSPGTGYGLYLADTVITQYGGDIWVESDGANGSTFVIELPLADE